MKPNGLNNGEWINIGHKSSLLSHPYSVNYMCNYCGFELYWPFALPRYCPKCGQKMKNATYYKTFSFLTKEDGNGR